MSLSDPNPRDPKTTDALAAPALARHGEVLADKVRRKDANRLRKWPMIWLAYTGFLFIEPILEPRLYRWIVSFSALAVFLLIYFVYIHATNRGKPLRFWALGAIFLLGLVVFPINQGASTFFIYGTSFLPFTIESTRRVLAFFAAAVALVLAEGWVFSTQPGILHLSWPNVAIAIFLMLLIGCGNIFFAEQKRAECRLREAQDENLALAAVAERERIARDLHDVLGHTLSVITLKAELAGRLLSIDPARAAVEIGDVERTARTALAEVREAIGGYRARGLAAEIESARLTLEAAGVTLVAEGDPAHRAALTPQEETALALVLREAVTNIVRHAHARSCRLLFVNEPGQRRLVVEDDGEHAIEREGNGLRGMRQRVEGLGGRFQLERRAAGTATELRGTRLLIDLPVHESHAI
jgi:two-component system sensor histidine kinase DesK